MDWMLARFASAPEGARAFVHQGHVTSYADLSRSIDACANALRARGVQGGDTVLVVADYSPTVFAMLLALASLACTVVPDLRSRPLCALPRGWRAVGSRDTPRALPQ